MSTIIKTLQRHRIKITNPDKLLFPKDHITKLKLVEYYEKIAPKLLPYCKSRPLTQLRYPDGILGKSFYQKNIFDYYPTWIKTKTIKRLEETGSNTYVVCQNSATLVYLANQACITPHMWLSKIDRLDYPDQIIFDLDPSGSTIKKFSTVCEVALILKKLLENIGLTPFVMTTGSKGLHVRVPIKREYSYDAVRAFAQEIADAAIELDPKRMTREMRKDKRGNRVFIDILRNSFGATAVIPYAVRAHPKAPVATPLEWEELQNPTLTSQKYTIATIFARLKTKDKVWHDFHKHAQSLSHVLKKHE